MSYSDAINTILDANAESLRTVVADAIEPSILPEIAKWAEENFRLSPDDSASPGLVRLHKYQREILRAWAEPHVRTAVLRGSSQIGKSVIGLIIAAYSVRFRQGPTRLATESDASALKFARERVAPMVRENLSDLQAKRKSGRGGQKELKFSNSSSLTLVNAGTPAGMSSSPVRTFIATEVRGWPLSSGKDGDPLALAKARGKTFADYKLFVESSPGIAKACRLSEEYTRGDCHLWHVTCQHCGHEAPMNYDAIPGFHFVAFKRPADAAMSCCECGSLWSPVERATALYNGRFVSTKESDDGETISFHFSELESAQYTLESIVRRVEESRKSSEKLQTAFNLILGQPFDPEENAGLELINESLESSIERYNALQLLPAEALIITAGVDVQIDRLEIQTVGHGAGKRRWSLEYHVIYGNPDGEQLWADLKEWLLTKRYKHPSGTSLTIKAAAIDSGNNVQAVYNFAADALARGRAWHAIKGMPGSRPIAKKSVHTSLRAGTQHKLIQVGVDSVKSVIFDAFSHDGEENRIYLPNHYDQAFHDSLTAERKIISHDTKGRPVIAFKKFKHGARNEALDTLVYALAAFELITPTPDFAAILRTLDNTTKTPEIDYMAHVRAAAEGRGNAYGETQNDR